jgi:prepilin-type N-terminal cleavage/methylation domain-containing protein
MRPDRSGFSLIELLIVVVVIGILADFTVTEGVNITINEATLGQGWAATGWHDALPSRVCGIYYGNASPANATPATAPGVIACQP